jgi:hypothetical protein
MTSKLKTMNDSALHFGPDGRLNMEAFSQPFTVTQMFNLSKYAGTPDVGRGEGGGESVDISESGSGTGVAPTMTTMMEEGVAAQEEANAHAENETEADQIDPYELLGAGYSIPTGIGDRKLQIVKAMSKSTERVLKLIPGITQAKLNKYIADPVEVMNVTKNTAKWAATLNKRLDLIRGHEADLGQVVSQDLINSINLYKIRDAKSGTPAAQTHLYKLYGMT